MYHIPDVVKVIVPLPIQYDIGIAIDLRIAIGLKLYLSYLKLASCRLAVECSKSLGIIS